MLGWHWHTVEVLHRVQGCVRKGCVVEIHVQAT